MCAIADMKLAMTDLPAGDDPDDIDDPDWFDDLMNLWWALLGNTGQ